MGCSYLGTLDHRDPMYDILLNEACPDVRGPVFHVDRMSERHVYKYTEEKSRTAIVGKFFRLDDRKEERVARIKGEFEKLRSIRGFGFDRHPNYVVRPISREERIGLALIEDFVSGRDLDHYLKDAVYHGREKELKERLAKLAAFLFALHMRTRAAEHVDLDSVSAYFRKVVGRLLSQGLITEDEQAWYLRKMDRWLGTPLLQEARSVVVHGDATPTNFIFTERWDVVAIDLERSKDCDMVYDIGMVSGEIKHAFLWRTGDPFLSEPFIRHFLKSYAGHFKDPERAFRKITMRNPFYMALTELRVARNGYLGWDYRKRLLHEARECLKWGLRLN